MKKPNDLLSAALTRDEIVHLANAMFHRMHELISEGVRCDNSLPDAQGREDLLELATIARMTAMLGAAVEVRISIAED